MSSEELALITQIQALACNPVLWDTSGEAADAVGFFDWLWSRTYQKHQVDIESRWIEEPYENPSINLDYESLGELLAGLKNFRDRWPMAAIRYIQEMRRFWALRAVTPTEHPKHYPKTDMTMAELCEHSRSGSSLLNPGWPRSDCRRLLDSTRRTRELLLFSEQARTRQLCASARAAA